MSVVCRSCLEVIARGSQYFNLNVETDSSAMLIRSQLEACVPELAVDVIKDSVICNNCVDALCIAYRFKKKCMDTEEKIYKYILEANAESDCIDINLVLKWSSNDDYRLPSYVVRKPGRRISSSVNISDNCNNLPRTNVEFLKVSCSEQDDLSANSTAAASAENIKSEVPEVDFNITNSENVDIPSRLNISAEQISKVEAIIPQEPEKIEDLEYSDEALNTPKLDLDQLSGDLSCDDDTTSLLVDASPPEPQNEIVSGLSCNFDQFCEFENQFAGYTMDKFYSSRLVALPECSVVLEHLTEGDIKKWTAKAEPLNRSRRTRFNSFNCNYRTPFVAKFLTHVKTCDQQKQIKKRSPKMHRKKKKKATALPNQRIYRCSICNFRAEYRSSFQLHLQTHKEFMECTLKCYSCDFNTTKRAKMVHHVQLHKRDWSSSAYFQCQLCECSTTSYDSLKEHSTRHNAFFYKCIECLYSSPSKKVLRKHYQLHHYSEQPFKCSKCGIVCLSQNKLINHVLMHSSVDRNCIFREHNYSFA